MGMPENEKDIARIDANMQTLMEFAREHKVMLRDVVMLLTETRASHDALAVRVGALESDKTWIVRLIFASLLAAGFGLVKAAL
jgi:hypothetical protein